MLQYGCLYINIYIYISNGLLCRESFRCCSAVAACCVMLLVKMCFFAM